MTNLNLWKKAFWVALTVLCIAATLSGGVLLSR
jgi:hypothetical protein